MKAAADAAKQAQKQKEKDEKAEREKEEKEAARLERHDRTDDRRAAQPGLPPLQREGVLVGRARRVQFGAGTCRFLVRMCSAR